MVRKRMWIRAGRSVLLMVVTLLFLSCDGLFLYAKLKSIFAVPGRYEYTLGESFDESNLEVYGIYEDGSSEQIPTQKVSFAGDFDTFRTTAGLKVITVQYAGLTASFKILIQSKNTSGSDSDSGSGTTSTPDDNGGGFVVVW
jgi:cytochrome c-type biogenesis protein CcmE